MTNTLWRNCPLKPRIKKELQQFISLKIENRVNYFSGFNKENVFVCNSSNVDTSITW